VLRIQPTEPFVGFVVLVERTTTSCESPEQVEDVVKDYRAKGGTKAIDVWSVHPKRGLVEHVYGETALGEEWCDDWDD